MEIMDIINTMDAIVPRAWGINWKNSVCVEKIRLMRVKIMQYALEILDHMERMDCMEYMDQVVGNIFGNII